MGDRAHHVVSCSCVDMDDIDDDEGGDHLELSEFPPEWSAKKIEKYVKMHRKRLAQSGSRSGRDRKRDERRGSRRSGGSSVSYDGGSVVASSPLMKH